MLELITIDSKIVIYAGLELVPEAFGLLFTGPMNTFVFAKNDYVFFPGDAIVPTFLSVFRPSFLSNENTSMGV